MPTPARIHSTSTKGVLCDQYVQFPSCLSKPGGRNFSNVVRHADPIVACFDATFPPIPRSCIHPDRHLVLQANLVEQGPGPAADDGLLIVEHLEQALPHLPGLLAGIDGLPDAALLVV
jgi:hypothetical protein